MQCHKLPLFIVMCMPAQFLLWDGVVLLSLDSRVAQQEVQIQNWFSISSENYETESHISACSRVLLAHYSINDILLHEGKESSMETRKSHICRLGLPSVTSELNISLLVVVMQGSQGVMAVRTTRGNRASRPDLSQNGGRSTYTVTRTHSPEYKMN